MAGSDTELLQRRIDEGLDLGAQIIVPLDLSYRQKLDAVPVLS